MKKVLALLLLLIVACEGTSEETSVEDTTTTTVEDTTTTTVEDTTTTTVEDTTTTTIPPAPTSEINYIELYNSKLGTELCSDAKEIDTTSEECLRQYRDNLETVFSYAENLETYISELNKYFESYPSAMTQEYTSLFQFVNNEYQTVPEIYGLVANKYLERFGGEPSLTSFGFDIKSLKSWCPAEFTFGATENLKSGEVTFINSLNELITIKVSPSTIINLNVTGGNFKFQKAVFENFLNETFLIENDFLNQNFNVKNFGPMITEVKFDEPTRTVEISFNPGEADVKNVIVVFERKSLENHLHFSLQTNNKLGAPLTKLHKDRAIIGLLNDIPSAPEPITLYQIFVTYHQNLDATNSTQFVNSESIKGYKSIKNCSDDTNNFKKINYDESKNIFQYQNSAFQQFLNAELIIND